MAKEDQLMQRKLASLLHEKTLKAKEKQRERQKKHLGPPRLSKGEQPPPNPPDAGLAREPGTLFPKRGWRDSWKKSPLLQLLGSFQMRLTRGYHKTFRLLF